MPVFEWNGVATLTAHSFTCGHCSHLVASDKGYFGKRSNAARADRFIRFCPRCERPTYSEPDMIVPGVLPGKPVDHVPQNVSVLYGEARKAAGAGAPTASVLASRKLIMNIAVNQGAPAGQTFFAYVEYLADNNFIPPNGRTWVDLIRQRGNEATHEIAPMTNDDAEKLIMFIEMLLKFIYEFQHYANPPEPQAVGGS